MLDGAGPKRLLDLRPPVSPTLHSDEILPERKASLHKPVANTTRGLETIAQGIGYENARLGLTAWARSWSGRLCSQ